jgi:hypothetical protein
MINMPRSRLMYIIHVLLYFRLDAIDRPRDLDLDSFEDRPD